MRIKVNKHGMLLCIRLGCRGRLIPLKRDRFRFLRCRKCEKDYHLTGVDSPALNVVLIVEFNHGKV